MTNTVRCRITKTAVDKLPPGLTLRDIDLKGFGVRRQKGDAIYFLQRKVHGDVRWYTIGRHGSPWTPETARKEASRLLFGLASGHDPRKEQLEREHKRPVSDVSQQYLKEHGPKLKPRTREEYDRLFAKFINPRFGRKAVGDLSRAEVSKFHAGMSKTPSQANFALTALSALFSWCEERGYRPPQSNPCRGITRNKHQKIERYLTADEFARLGQVLDRLGAEQGAHLYALAAIRLLLLTGARRSEILTLRWQEVDLSRRRLLLHDSKTGPKVIHLNDGAVAVLSALPRVRDNPYVIVGHVTGTHLVNIHKTWDLVRTLAGLEDVRIHDLRHSFASLAAADGASLPMIGKLLGHNQPRTTARYTHLADDPVHQLNQRVGAAIGNAMRGSHSRPVRSFFRFRRSSLRIDRGPDAELRRQA
jgi:integrase